MMKPSDYADLMYREGGRVSHHVPFGDDRALCGMYALGRGRDEFWYGTGDMDEYEKAASLPVCSDCAEKAS